MTGAERPEHTGGSGGASGSDGRGTTPWTGDDRSGIGTDEGLSRALRREADLYPVGRVPVEEVVRRGRAARRRRTVAGSGVTVVLAALVCLVAYVSYFTAPGPDGEAPPASPTTAVPRPVPSVSPEPGSTRIVESYEVVDIGGGVRIALLPEGRQNFVYGEGDLLADIDEARRRGGGDSIRPESLSAGSGSEWELVVGAFRTRTAPAVIVVRTADGKEHRAGILRLRGDSGWGVYHAFVGDGWKDFSVTAYAADGRVLVSGDFPAVEGGPPRN
ncbi:hypothetical protein ACWEFL_14550 [Streptomyces sp. NPDC004838]